MNDRTRNLEKILLIWSALLLLATASGHLHSPDGEVNYRTTRSLATGGGYAIDPMPDGAQTRKAENGKEYSQYGPLQPLLATPLFWLGDAVSFLLPENWLSAQSERLNSTVMFYRPSETRWERPFPGLYPNDHRERGRRILVSSFNSIVTWATVILLILWSRDLFGDSSVRLALPATYLVATWAWPHSRGFYTEPLALFFILAAVYVAARIGKPNDDEKGKLIRAALVGVFAGLAVLARLDSVVATIGIAFIACARILGNKSDRAILPPIAIGFAAFLLLAAILPLQNYLRFGSILATGYSDQPEGVKFSIPLLDSLWIYFLSPGKGIFGYSPPLLAALIAWPLFFKRNFSTALGILLMILGYVFVVGRWQNLGGWCWGPRHLFQINALVLLPLPYLLLSLKESAIRKVGLPALIVTGAYGVFVQFCGVLVDFMWPLDRAHPTTEQVLSGAFYGPLLHLDTWRFERTPDWFLADLWRSGEMGARLFSGLIWIFMIVATLELARRSYRLARNGKRT